MIRLLIALLIIVTLGRAWIPYPPMAEQVAFENADVIGQASVTSVTKREPTAGSAPSYTISLQLLTKGVFPLETVDVTWNLTEAPPATGQTFMVCLRLGAGVELVHPDWGFIDADRAVPQPEPPYREHVVSKGESLWSIAAHWYGAGKRWRVLSAANFGDVNQDRPLQVGARLRVLLFPKVNQGLLKPQVKAKVETDFWREARLTDEEVQEVIKLGIDCGMRNVERISTHQTQLVKERSIVLRSTEFTDGRDTTVDMVYMFRAGWTDAVPDEAAKQRGNFWVRKPYCYTKHFRDYDFRGKVVRVDITKTPLAIADEVMALIASNRVKFRSEFEQSRYKDLDFLNAEIRIRDDELWVSDNVINFRRIDGALLILGIGVTDH